MNVRANAQYAIWFKTDIQTPETFCSIDVFCQSPLFLEIQGWGI